MTTSASGPNCRHWCRSSAPPPQPSPRRGRKREAIARAVALGSPGVPDRPRPPARRGAPGGGGAPLPGDGSGPDSWPDPHGGQGPSEEEYSRCLDPAKYLVLRARAQAWADVLVGRGLADVVEVTDLDEVPRSVAAATPDRAYRIEPRRPGALPVLVSLRGMDGVAETVLELGVGRPSIGLARLPYCGCDACDDGSEALLEELDGRLVDVVRGTFVHVTTPHGYVVTREDGLEASSDGEGEEGVLDRLDDVVADARAGRSTYPAVLGPAYDARRDTTECGSE
ncbi:DUF6226 family protein [Nocardioides lijunqiniae]|uniref:DUF6226 family protein n=1 Tax=Nocardioides lijunqiniae TaxID=2760832 RepID=UPI0030B866F2